jgi:type III pantothenate kinase
MKMKNITLCLDFGNTRWKAAILANGSIEKQIVLDNDPLQAIGSLLQEYSPQRAILSSVVDHDPAIEMLVAGKTRFHKLSHLTKLPFTTPVGKPETIGADRLALAAAAVHFWPGKNNLVIGLGTCITYNFINKHSEFVGGSISPGLEMRLKSMHQFTARLPLIKPNWNVPLIGYDTSTNILSGAVIGMAKEIEGITGEYEQKFGNFNVLLTGGDLAILASHIKKKIFADPELIFKGLYAISEVNNP